MESTLFDHIRRFDAQVVLNDAPSEKTLLNKIRRFIKTFLRVYFIHSQVKHA